MLLLTEVTSYDDGFEGRDSALLVAEERRLLLRGGGGCWELGEDDEVVVVEVVDHDVRWRVVGGREEGQLIGQGAYLLLVGLPIHCT
jgi:hypothetical protein